MIIIYFLPFSEYFICQKSNPVSVMTSTEGEVRKQETQFVWQNLHLQGGNWRPYPADFILWLVQFNVMSHAVQQSSDADFYPYTQSTASMILI